MFGCILAITGVASEFLFIIRYDSSPILGYVCPSFYQYVVSDSLLRIQIYLGNPGGSIGLFRDA